MICCLLFHHPTAGRQSRSFALPECWSSRLSHFLVFLKTFGWTFMTFSYRLTILSCLETSCPLIPLMMSHLRHTRPKAWIAEHRPFPMVLTSVSSLLSGTRTTQTMNPEPSLAAWLLQLSMRASFPCQLTTSASLMGNLQRVNSSLCRKEPCHFCRRQCPVRCRLCHVQLLRCLTLYLSICLILFRLAFASLSRWLSALNAIYFGFGWDHEGLNHLKILHQWHNPRDIDLHQ